MSLFSQLLQNRTHICVDANLTLTDKFNCLRCLRLHLNYNNNASEKCGPINCLNLQHLVDLQNYQINASLSWNKTIVFTMWAWYVQLVSY